jgi:hypothetical protein
MFTLEPGVVIKGDTTIESNVLGEMYTLELDDRADSILVTFTPVMFRVLFPVTLAFSNVFVMFSATTVELFSNISLVSATTLPFENERTTALMNPGKFE